MLDASQALDGLPQCSSSTGVRAVRCVRDGHTCGSVLSLEHLECEYLSVQIKAWCVLLQWAESELMESELLLWSVAEPVSGL